MKFVLKRDSKLEPFDQERITQAIYKAVKAVGGKDKEQAKKVSDEVVAELNQTFGDDGVPTVEEIQDLVEKRLIENGHASTAKAYILYRKQHNDMRELASLLSSSDLVDQYLEVEDWRVKENSNMSYSLQGLNNYLSSAVIAKYWIARIYPESIAASHFSGDIHIHDLGVLGPYCVGWDINDLLLSGFGGVHGKIESKPAKHFRTALGQVVNFFYTLQGEAAGAQAFSNFDTYLAPFIRYDNLAQKDVEQALQEFFFNMNVPTRVGFQAPFTNLTLDLTVPDFMKNEAVIHNGKITSDTYGDFTKELEMLNLAFAEGMKQGDAKGRVFTFPIPTYNITKDFDWDSPTSRAIFEVTAKYGVPNFSNFVNSDMKPEDVRSMCCRLRIDNRELRKRGGGFFGANPLTGSIGVVTLNIPRIGYLSKDEDEFFEKLGVLMETAKASLEIKRKVLEAFTDNGLYPYSKRYLRHVKDGFDKYWKNHFSTIGIVGINEALINLLGQNIASKEGQSFAVKILTYMRKQIADYQEDTGNIYNLEATPAEGTSYRLARLDKKRYRDIIFANQKHIIAEHAEPFYTNSSQLPVDFAGDLFEALEHQETLQTLYTGGTNFHIFIGERLPTWKSAAELVKKVSWNTKLPYFTLTPTFSICPSHGYTTGEHKICPVCGAKNEVYSRVVGYLRPVDQWNDGKQAEFAIRKTFDRSTVVASAPLTV
ncbi:ribonucleoside triphosphate reductase [Candidatus Bathycorpusculum sp.]|uniref:ribonucleoside triphosphate reductase n=1 Tax=Candidatus Bathycorpusculum sp. TaxID=2994959 RepID=UPI00282C53D8|nr:ribonucleoside triphosphate reductase [Candidatus Termitimicrobium sp.]MCL2431775.1 ribonucleoside triphosphate reductase [Candidatus Termitimicrobium sp.]